MSSRAKILAVLGFIVLIIAGVYYLYIAAKPAPEKPGGIKAIKAIVDEVHNLASNGIPASVVFAKKLTNVLSAHNVSLPDKLARLVAPKPPVPDPNDDELRRIYESGHKIYSVCEESTRTKDPNYAVSVSLRNELLTSIASYSPSSFARVEAANLLGRRAHPPGEEDRWFSDVPPAMAKKACRSAIIHAINSCSRRQADNDSAMALRLRMLLVPYYLGLEAMTAENLTKEYLDKIVAELNSKVKSALSETQNEKAVTLLNSVSKELKRYEEEQGTELLVQSYSWRNELEPVIKAFLDAVNKEDKETACKYMTEKTAKYFSERVKAGKYSDEKAGRDMPTTKTHSLRQGISREQSTEEIRYQGMGQFSGQGDIGLHAPVYVIIVDEKGSIKHKSIGFGFVKTPKGWLIGGE